MIARIGKERVFNAFLSESAPVFQRSFERLVIGPEDVSARFGIKNFLESMEASAHWARWRVGYEHRLAGGGVDRHVGFDIDLGTGPGAVRFRYFPRIWGNSRDWPLQLPSLYVSGGRRDGNDGTVSIYNAPAIIRAVTVIGRSIKLTGDIEAGNRRSYPALWLEPDTGSPGDFRFRLGERPVRKRAQDTRLGSHGSALLPGFGASDTSRIMEFEDGERYVQNNFD